MYVARWGWGGRFERNTKKFSALFRGGFLPLVQNTFFIFFIHSIFATPSPPLEDKIMKIIEFLGGGDVREEGWQQLENIRKN
jgi:hypothetical protein